MLRKKFSISTFSELFVLLAIIFFVQTVVSVTVNEKVKIVDDLSTTQVTLNQYPFDNDRTDHLRYISIGKYAVVFGTTGCLPGSAFLEGKPKSRVVDGICQGIAREIEDPRFIGEAGDQKAVERFERLVQASYGVGFRLTKEAGRQSSVTLVFDPKITTKDLQIHIGLCVCTIDAPPTPIAVPQSWNVPFKAVPKPHPLIIEVTSLRGGKLKRSTGLYFSHKNDFHEVRPGAFAPVASAAARYAFAADGCAIKGQGLRENFIREISLSWPDLVSGLQWDD